MEFGLFLLAMFGGGAWLVGLSAFMAGWLTEYGMDHEERRIWRQGRYRDRLKASGALPAKPKGIQQPRCFIPGCEGTCAYCGSRAS